MEPEITGITIKVSVDVLNTKGLKRRAGLDIDIELAVYDEHIANKAKWNKFIGDHTKQAIEACLERIKEEYGGIEAMRAPPEKGSVEETVEELDKKAKEAWEEQNPKAEAASKTPPPGSDDRGVFNPLEG